MIDKPRPTRYTSRMKTKSQLALHFTATTRRDTVLIKKVRRRASRANKSVVAMLREILEAHFADERDGGK